MTGKLLSDDHRAILAKLLQIPKLNNHEIAWVLNITDRTVRRRRYEFAATGQLAKHKDVSQNATKLKPHHLEKLLEWHKNHPNAFLEDMQLFLLKDCGLNISLSSISRQMKRALGDQRWEGRSVKRRTKKQREANERLIPLQEFQRLTGSNDSNGSSSDNGGNGVNGDNGGNSGNGDNGANGANGDNGANDGNNAPSTATGASGLYLDHLQLAPLRMAAEHEAPRQEPGAPMYHAAGGQQHYPVS